MVPSIVRKPVQQGNICLLQIVREPEQRGQCLFEEQSGFQPSVMIRAGLQIVEEGSNLSVSERQVELSFVQIAFPYVPFLIGRHEFENRLICVYPVPLTYRIRSNSNHNFTWTLRYALGLVVQEEREKCIH
jgi:hypothetical protein